MQRGYLFWVEGEMEPKYESSSRHLSPTQILALTLWWAHRRCRGAVGVPGLRGVPAARSRRCDKAGAQRGVMTGVGWDGAMGAGAESREGHSHESAAGGAYRCGRKEQGGACRGSAVGEVRAAL